MRFFRWWIDEARAASRKEDLTEFMLASGLLVLAAFVGFAWLTILVVWAPALMIGISCLSAAIVTFGFWIKSTDGSDDEDDSGGPGDRSDDETD